MVESHSEFRYIKFEYDSDRGSGYDFVEFEDWGDAWLPVRELRVSSSGTPIHGIAVGEYGRWTDSDLTLRDFLDSETFGAVEIDRSEFEALWSRWVSAGRPRGGCLVVLVLGALGLVTAWLMDATRS